MTYGWINTFPPYIPIMWLGIFPGPNTQTVQSVYTSKVQVLLLRILSHLYLPLQTAQTCPLSESVNKCLLEQCLKVWEMTAVWGVCQECVCGIVSDSSGWEVWMLDDCAVTASVRGSDGSSRRCFLYPDEKHRKRSISHRTAMMIDSRADISHLRKRNSDGTFITWPLLIYLSAIEYNITMINF